LSAVIGTTVADGPFDPAIFETGANNMFPIGDDDSTRRTVPVVTWGLIVLNVLFFLVELNGGEAFIQQWSVVPRRLLANPAGDFPTIFTSMFMHGGWLHLLGNMLYLWIFGDNVEDNFGHAKFLTFYLLCGVAATFAQVLVSSNSSVPNLGASGAIAGVLAAYIVMFPQGQVKVMMGRGVIPMPALVVIGFWIVLQFISGIGSISQTADTGGVAYLAHIGGFIAGLVLTFLFRGTRTSRATIE
jgi:membrane associated rhomboid family serine protease